MSGYLERLVAGTAQRTTQQPSIRPVLGSVFSAPQHSGVSEVHEENRKETGPIELRNEDIVEGARQEVAEPQPFAGVEPPRDHHAMFTQITRPEATHHEVVRDNRQSIEIVRHIAVSDPGISQLSVHHETEEKRERVESAEAPAETVLAYKPLMTESAPHPVSEVRPFKSSDTFASGRSGKSKQADTALREPDEIQIHIGRIEVVAVPQQQAVRPAAKSSRKSPSLDDYLKRGRRGG
jgi:hypothetical protein